MPKLMTCRTCQYCRQVFRTPLLCAKHEKLHYPDCQGDDPCASRWTLRDPKATILFDLPTFECAICETVLQSARALETHMKRHEEKEEGVEFACEKCPRKFTTAAGLARHRVTHNQIRTACFPCEQCHLTFMTHSARTQHAQRSHKPRHLCSPSMSVSSPSPSGIGAESTPPTISQRRSSGRTPLFLMAVNRPISVQRDLGLDESATSSGTSAGGGTATRKRPFSIVLD